MPVDRFYLEYEAEHPSGGPHTYDATPRKADEGYWVNHEDFEELLTYCKQLEWTCERILDPQLLATNATGVDPLPARSMMFSHLAKIMNEERPSCAE